MTKSIVVVHGIGSPAPGEEIESVRSAICSDQTLSRSYVIRRGKRRVPVCEVRGADISVNLYEMNWVSQVQAGTGPLAVIVQLFKVIFALVQIAESGWSERKSGASYFDRTPDEPSVVGRGFRFILMTIAIWAPYTALSILLVHFLRNAGSGSSSWLAPFIFTCIAAFVLAAITASLRRFDAWALWGGLLWWVCLLAFGSLISFGVIERENVRWLLSDFVKIAVVGSSTFVLLGILEVMIRLIRNKRSHLNYRAALIRSASYALPFFVIVGAWGPILFAIHFLLIEQLDGFGIIVPLYIMTEAYHQISSDITYNVFLMEVINAVAFVSLLAAMIVCSFGWTLILKSGWVGASPWGEKFRGLVSIWLCLIAAASATVVISLALSSFNLIFLDWHLADPGFQGLRQIIHDLFGANMALAGAGASDFEIYMLSAWRLLPVLVFVHRGLRRGALLASQVIFYISPESSPLSTKKALQNQFEDVVAIAREHSGSNPVVLGYSQGSKIAVDAVPSVKDQVDFLVTVGSPVGVLHHRYLGLSAEPGLPWINIYRYSDFIGGPVPSESARQIGTYAEFEKSHYDYYGIPEVQQALGTASHRLMGTVPS